jgi:hypothetical protein
LFSSTAIVPLRSFSIPTRQIAIFPFKTHREAEPSAGRLFAAGRESVCFFPRDSRLFQARDFPTPKEKAVTAKFIRWVDETLSSFFLSVVGFETF